MDWVGHEYYDDKVWCIKLGERSVLTYQCMYNNRLFTAGNVGLLYFQVVVDTILITFRI